MNNKDMRLISLCGFINLVQKSTKAFADLLILFTTLLYFFKSNAKTANLLNDKNIENLIPQTGEAKIR
ncbi:MAG: hypothetical protein GYA51_12210 [Candidatus Methanofastidiosa archaeon]|nr:hypothetical protein [Candidatus Methanofastidiosa archaeon]